MPDDNGLPEESSGKRPWQWLSLGLCLPCVAISCLMVMLLITILLKIFEVPLGIEPLSIGKSFALIYHSVIVPVLGVLGDMLKSLSPWGVIVFVILGVILCGPTWIRETLSSSKWELPGGVKFDGTAVPAAFRKELSEAARVVDRANKEIGEAYLSARSFASQLRDRHDIPAIVTKLAVTTAKLIGPRCPEDFRLSLYVPDFIFSDRLYQFTEYYDRTGQKLPGNKAGRTFSIRYGVIGRVWRSGVPEIEGDLISQQDRDQLGSDHSPTTVERFIARRWGLTLEEAIHVSRYNSYGAIKLSRADKSLGVLFFDSQAVNAFCESGELKQLEKRLTEMLGESPLLLKLLEISSEVAPWSGRIQIFRNS